MPDEMTASTIGAVDPIEHQQRTDLGRQGPDVARPLGEIGGTGAFDAHTSMMRPLQQGG